MLIMLLWEIISRFQENGKICACPSAWKQSQQRCPTSPSQLYPGQSHYYSKGGWKGNLSSPHRPPFFATYTNRFAAPSTFHYPRSPKIGRPLVITAAVDITTTTIVVVTPRLISTTAPSVSANNQVTTTTPGHSRMNTVNISPYRVENTTNCSINGASSSDLSNNAPSTPTLKITLNTPYSTRHSVNGATTSSSIPSNIDNQAISESEQAVPSRRSSKPTVNTSTTPTVNTLCDVRMDTVTTDN